jgi:hypothetical protein
MLEPAIGMADQQRGRDMRHIFSRDERDHRAVSTAGSLIAPCVARPTRTTALRFS